MFAEQLRNLPPEPLSSISFSFDLARMLMGAGGAASAGGSAGGTAPMTVEFTQSDFTLRSDTWSLTQNRMKIATQLGNNFHQCARAASKPIPPSHLQSLLAASYLLDGGRSSRFRAKRRPKKLQTNQASLSTQPQRGERRRGSELQLQNLAIIQARAQVIFQQGTSKVDVYQ